ncbi:MAG TPA: nucleoside triphosphate pyrophosphohydrolase [Candidatus Egerieousia sp.]|nr:nucleoside triphosphate pyrophosphohydrolase [Candidatus Egerieousia sp.]HPT06151.1 nucleoside triphosphate pyrophosphohydrolase [Candidatus Egerieousia sp.]
MEKSDRTKENAAFDHLLEIMDTLRVKCPWDKVQTIESLRPQTIEETYELSDSILKGDLHDMSKELGDLLLHIVFYAKIGKEKGAFDISDVINQLCNKLIYRHPHVYSSTKVKNAGEVVQNWEQLKTKEKDGNKTVLSGVPEGLPSMIKAYRMQDKARAVGFDWKKKEDVWDKVAEEMCELKDALSEYVNEQAKSNANEQQANSLSKIQAENELGDVLFSVINAARLYDLNPDSALEKTCKKFRSRFGYLEEHTIRQGKSLKDMTLEEMDKYWDEAKSLEKK